MRTAPLLQCDQNQNAQDRKIEFFFGVEGCGYTAWLSWLSGMDNVEPSVNTTRRSCQSQASGLLHQDAALIAGKVISLQTQLSVCGLCSKGNLVQTVFGIINQDCTRIFYGLSGGIEKGDLDIRSLLGKPYLALAGT